MVLVRMFSYEWFSRYGLKEKLKRRVTSKGTGTRTNGVTTIDLYTLSNIAYNVIMIRIRDSYCLQTKSKV